MLAWLALELEVWVALALLMARGCVSDIRTVTHCTSACVHEYHSAKTSSTMGVRAWCVVI